MTKNAERREKFLKLGKEISAQAWRDKAADHQFEFRSKPSADPQLSSRLYGPALRSIQFERTSKR